MKLSENNLIIYRKAMLFCSVAILLIFSLWIVWMGIARVFVRGNDINTGIFNTEIDNYMNYYTKTIGVPPVTSNNISGPVVVVNVNKKEIHNLYHWLPATLAAKSPKEVHAIIFIEVHLDIQFWYDVELRKTKQKLAGFKETWNMTVLDLQNQTVIFSKSYSKLPDKTGVLFKETIERIIYNKNGNPGLTGTKNLENYVFEDILRVCNYSLYSPWPHSWR